MNRKLHTPGDETAHEEAEDVGNKLQPDPTPEEKAAEAQAEAEDVGVLKERIAQLEAQLASNPNADPYAHLPDQSEVNSKTITRAVLTKQGWVAPERKPMVRV